MTGTRIFGTIDKAINKFSEYGRTKNGIYKNLEKRGLTEIRERNVSKGRSVILASSPDAIDSVTIGLDKKKGYVQKGTSRSIVLTFFDKRTKNISKTYSNWSGNVEKTYSKMRTYINSKLSGSRTSTELTGKSKTVVTTGSMTGSEGIAKRIDHYNIDGGSFVYQKSDDGYQEFLVKNPREKYYYAK